MEVLYLLIPVAIIFTLLASALYIWAVASGQYDDLDKEADAVLFEEPPPAAESCPDREKARKDSGSQC